jgi:hypothetical protein
MSKELEFVADTFNTTLLSKIGSSFPTDLNEDDLVETLRRNKVTVEFESNLNRLGASRQFFERYPKIRVFCQNVNAAVQKDLAQFHRIEDEFAKDNIVFILIKSDGPFPCETDNLDILVRTNEFAQVLRLLEKLGYFELPQVREKHKFLFRQTKAYAELPIHVHTRVEWEGEQFMNTEDLWSRCRIVRKNRGYHVPSLEDCILVTIAHLFFENHEIGLGDLLKLDACIRSHDTDWDYVFNHAHRLGWSNALYLTLLLANKSYAFLFSSNLLPRGVLSRIVESTRRCDRIMLKTVKPTRRDLTPLAIPYAVPAFYFVRKVMRSSGLGLSERLQNIDFVAADVMKRKIKLARSSRMNETNVGFSMD